MLENPETPTGNEPIDPSSPPDSPSMPDQDAILAALRTVRDPEIGINVVDLGLVYTVQTRAGEVDVEMTLTSPACPAGPQILRDAVAALERLQGVDRANVRLVLTPPWSPDRMSDEARDELGIF
jgi:metal-sulfur cluster biosynthetic enzyme